MMKTLLVAGLCMSASLLSIAQNSKLTVSVQDQLSAETLIGASVQIGDKGCTTDQNGSCAIELPNGNHQVQVRFLGYDTKTQTIKLNSNTTMVVLLNESGNLLQQTTVTAGRYEKPLSQVTVSLEVIKPAFLENNNTLSIESALDKVPGVNMVDGQPNIRGGSGFSYGAGSRVLILMDDLPALQADAGYPNWNDFSDGKYQPSRNHKGCSISTLWFQRFKWHYQFAYGFCKG